MNTLNFALILIILCEPGWTGAVFHRKFVGYTSNCKCIPDNFPCAKKGFRVRFNFGRTPSSCLPGLILCCDEGTWKRAASDDVLSFDFLQKSSLLENEQENLFTYYEDNGDLDEIEDSLESKHQDYRDNSDSTKNNPKERNIPILFSTKIGETDENDDNASNRLNGDFNIISTETSIKSSSNVQMLLPETSDISSVDENINSEDHHVDYKPLETVPEKNLVQSTSEFDKSHSDNDNDMISNNTTEPFDNVPGLETRLSSSSNMSSPPFHSSNEWQSESKPVLKADVAVTGELNVSGYPSNISQPLQYQQTTLSEPLQIPSSEYLDMSSVSEGSAEEFGSLNNKINITVAELEASDSHFDENVIKNTSIGNELTLDQPVTDGVLVVDEMTLKDVKNGTIDGEVNVVIPKVDEPVTDRSLIEDQMTLKKDVKNETLASKVHVMLPKVNDPVANHILIENEIDLTTGVDGTTTDEVKSTNYKYTTEITTSSNDFTISTMIPDDIEVSSLLETEVPSTEEPDNPILIDPETEVTTSSETSTPIYNYLEISTTNDDLGRSTLDESWYEVTTISPIEDNLEPSSSMDENYSLTTTNPPNMGEETSAYGTSTDNYIDASVRDPVNNNTLVSKVNTINTEQNQTKVDSKLLQGSEESNMAVPSNDRLLQDRVVCDSKLLSDSKCTLENYGSDQNIINTPFNEGKTASKGVTYKMVDEPFNASSTQDNDIEINSSVSSPNMVLNSGTNSRLPRENQVSTTENPGLTQRPNFKRLEELPMSPQPTNGSQISRTETHLTPTTTRKDTGPQTPIANETDTTDVDLSTFSIPLDIEAKSSQDEIADYLGDELVIITDSKVTLEPIHINSEEDEEGKEKEKEKSWKESSKFLKWVYNIFN